MAVSWSCLCITETATTWFHTLSLHDALPIFVANKATGEKFETYTSAQSVFSVPSLITGSYTVTISIEGFKTAVIDRKSTRLNSSHLVISYAVLCLKKKNTTLEAMGEKSMPSA